MKNNLDKSFSKPQNIQLCGQDGCWGRGTENHQAGLIACAPLTRSIDDPHFVDKSFYRDDMSYSAKGL
jgi:hypothetical protein